LRLSSILDPDCIVLDVGSGSKGEVLARLADPIARTRPDLDAAAIRAELVRRESESSTAIADGIAIPHARPEGRDVVTASFGRAPAGLDFDSIDGKPTTILFVLISPAANPEAHGKWLAHVARVLGDASTRHRLLEATTPQDVLDALDERERALEEADPAVRRAAPAGGR
jgi:mannitol/fructose-specific phosphotransferase system IIA component (Ntr-type)